MKIQRKTTGRRNLMATTAYSWPQRLLLVLVYFFISALITAGVAHAYIVQANTKLNSAESTTPVKNIYECTQVSIDDIDPALLTKEERIALLEGNLRDSIDSYSTCVSAVQQDMSGGAGSGAGSAGNEGPGEGQGENSDTSESMPASEQGVETPPNEQEVTEQTKPAKTITQNQRGVIPPKDNDKIICKLLYQEIKSVDDPDMLKGLKEQYTNYKCG